MKTLFKILLSLSFISFLVVFSYNLCNGFSVLEAYSQGSMVAFSFGTLALSAVLYMKAYSIRQKKMELKLQLLEYERQSLGCIYEMLCQKDYQNRKSECLTFSERYGKIFRNDLNAKRMSSNQISNLFKDCDEISLENLIIESKDCISWCVSKKLILNHCLVLTDVFIYGKNDFNVIFSDCIFFGKISIKEAGYGLSGGSATIERVFADQIEVSGKWSDIRMMNVSSGCLAIVSASISSAVLKNSQFYVLRMSCSNVKFKEDVLLSVNVKMSLKKKNEEKWRIFSDELICGKTAGKNYCDIYDFFEDFNLSNSINARAALIYYRNLQGLSGIWKFWYRIFGGMIEPLKVVAWMILSLGIFAGVYLSLDNPFVGESIGAGCRDAEGIGEAIYFSIITLTTVGYGDLTPCAYARFWASLEGILGILLGGAFLIAVSRKFFDRYKNL